jgi:enoyl-CoA hydratase/carnithine racemase
VGAVTQFATVRFEKRGPVALVTLDRPTVLNAYNVAMRDDLYAVLSAIDDDPEVRVCILRGRGRAFSTGGDVSEFGTAPSPVIARRVRFQRDVWGLLLRLRAATIAAVHGYAVGGGFEMLLLCDLRIVAVGTRLSLPETALGMVPGVAGTQTLPRAVGVGRALDLVFTDRWLNARAALACGVVNRVVPRAALDRAALAWARRLARLDPATTMAVRRVIRAAYDVPQPAACALERRLGLRLQADR